MQAQLHGLLECMVYSQAWKCNSEVNDLSVRERVTASSNYNECACILEEKLADSLFEVITLVMTMLWVW